MFFLFSVFTEMNGCFPLAFLRVMATITVFDPGHWWSLLENFFLCTEISSEKVELTFIALYSSQTEAQWTAFYCSNLIKLVSFSIGKLLSWFCERATVRVEGLSAQLAFAIALATTVWMKADFTWCHNANVPSLFHCFFEFTVFPLLKVAIKFIFA